MESDEYDLLCAWCGKTIEKSSVEGSHGICADCFRRLMKIPELTREQLDELPFGAILLDKSGTILEYNRTEQNLSHKTHDVVGKNFFTEVAPCTSIHDFKDEFEEFLRGTQKIKQFNFLFPFPHGVTKVRVGFVHASEGCGFVIVKKISLTNEEFRSGSRG